MDDAFPRREHGDVQRSVAWLGAAEQQFRATVFMVAVALHKALMDATAPPRRNLAA